MPSFAMNGPRLSLEPVLDLAPRTGPRPRRHRAGRGRPAARRACQPALDPPSPRVRIHPHPRMPAHDCRPFELVRRQAPYFMRRSALASMIAMRSLVGRMPEAAAQAPALAVVGHVVAAAVRAPQQRGHRVPRVRGHLGRRRVVAGHRDDVGSERPHLGDDRVERLDRGDLAGAVAVLAGRVGVLVVQEEVVVVGPGIAQDLELLVEVLRPAEHVHAEQARDPPVHRVDGDGRGAQPVALGERREVAVRVEPAEQDVVGPRLVRRARRAPGRPARSRARPCASPPGRGVRPRAAGRRSPAGRCR